MGASNCWLAFPVWSCALFAQAGIPADAAAVPSPRPLLPQLVLARLDEQPNVADFGLGGGGIAAARSPRRWLDSGCTTAGGVRVECLAVGVRLAFPSGRELLVAPDGFVHLRGGEVGGPFPGGLELRLADGDLVRITLVPGARQRLTSVVVGGGDQWLQPWRRGEPSRAEGRDTGWAGARAYCLGDGGELYRPIALGPLLVLDRVLGDAGAAASTPNERLVLFPAPLLSALDAMQRQHREPDPELRRALALVQAIVEHGDRILPAGSGLLRAERERLRWLLPAGFEIAFETTGQLAPRLQLFAPAATLPVVEWTVRADAAAFLVDPRDGRPGRRWHGNGVRLPFVLGDLQARSERFERGQALAVIERLRR
jgi:hypothetical protein